MTNAHPLIVALADDDPDVKKALTGIRRAVMPVAEIFESGPFGRTKSYDDINSGLLVTHTICGRRFAYALDYAKYLVALERRDKAEQRKHVLATEKGRGPRSHRTVAAA